MNDKKLNARQTRWLKELVSYDFVIKHIAEVENIEADALSRRLDYEFHSKLIKLMLKRKGEHFELAEAIEKNMNIIKFCHDLFTVRY